MALRTASCVAAVALALICAAAGSPVASRAAVSQAVEPTDRADGSAHRLSKGEVLKIASRDARAAAILQRHPGYVAEAQSQETGRWKVEYRDRHGDRFAELTVGEQPPEVVAVYTGIQVDWQMARGIPGAFGRKANAWYVWIPLMCAFFGAFFDWRRPLRGLHLDLLMLLSFSASQVYFNRGEVGTSVPLVLIPMVYVLGRMLGLIVRGSLRAGATRARVPVPVAWLAMALIFLVGFRVGLNLTNSNVIDVGYSGVIGADRIAHGQSPYGTFPEDNPAGDTYGPVAYYAYIPAELALPWGGTWDDLPAAHAAAIAFDLLTILGLFACGRRLLGGVEGTRLGVMLAYAWAAFPYTLLTMNSNANDSLLAALLVFCFLALSSRLGRAALLALATAVKFAPVALVPLFAGYDRRRMRDIAIFGAAFCSILVLTFVLVWPDGGLTEIWDRTVGFQLGRESPFSIWGQHDWLGPAQIVWQLLVGVLALACAVVPRRKSRLEVAALAVAVLVALQLAFEHWFYLYIVWWLPLALIVFLSRPDPEASAAR